jgi:FHS family L-fucose permease-like MFS transporter
VSQAAEQHGSASTAPGAAQAGGRSGLAFAYVTTLFFGWGFVTAVIDPLIPAVRSIFTLNYTESMLTQFAWFIAYGLVSLPAAAILARMGYVPAIVAALAAMVGGCLLIPLATHADLYPGVLAALFVIASGVTLLQVAANPLVAVLGRPDHSHFRLTLSQAFNSLGHVIGPYLGSAIMLSGGVFGVNAALDQAASREQSLRSIDMQFLIVAAFFAALGLFIWLVRGRIAKAAPPTDPKQAAPWRAFQSGWAVFGALAIFLYVGAEVAIASIMINFLLHIDFVDFLASNGFVDMLAGLGMVSASTEAPEIAGKVLGLCYWGGAMVGRFVGSWLLTRLPAGALLGVFATIAGCLCIVATQISGPVGGIAALSVGFFNSIMFPTIFTLTLDRSTAPTAATSGLLVAAIVGGAFLPLATGAVADVANLSVSFAVPLAAYVGVFAFAIAAARKPSAKPMAAASMS